MICRQIKWLAVFAGCAVAALNSWSAPGLAVTFTSAAGKSHSTSVSNLALYVARGEPPSPFVPPGPFTGVWEGNINADLRGEFYFQADLNGSFRLEINNALALEASLTNEVSPLTKAISLNKGANKLKATYT